MRRTKSRPSSRERDRSLRCTSITTTWSSRKTRRASTTSTQTSERWLTSTTTRSKTLIWQFKLPQRSFKLPWVWILTTRTSRQPGTSPRLQKRSLNQGKLHFLKCQAWSRSSHHRWELPQPRPFDTQRSRFYKSTQALEISSPQLTMPRKVAWDHRMWSTLTSLWTARPTLFCKVWKELLHLKGRRSSM